MSGIDRPAERFRILNGLDIHAQAKVRDRVKIVVD
jgi:predicted Zn-dependent protease